MKLIIFLLVISIFAVTIIPNALALREDTQDTWHTWEIEKEQSLQISLTDNKYATPQRIALINEVVMSDETLEIDDNLMHKGPKGNVSTYYLGWHGALNSITDTKLPVPKNLKFDLTDKATGNIVITLYNYKHPDGYSGFTSIYGDTMIISIYDVERQSTSQLQTITRHELGHAFGLEHATAPEDLMAQNITTWYPYISPCNVMALDALYNGQSTITCEE